MGESGQCSIRMRGRIPPVPFNADAGDACRAYAGVNASEAGVRADGYVARQPDHSVRDYDDGFRREHERGYAPADHEYVRDRVVLSHGAKRPRP